ncbi:MAG: AAA family ATPase [Bacilli bacterium]|nr:AAA family ATPase [Bacilli bacterium]
MLERFSVKGYRNFKDEIVFDLKRHGRYDFNTELIQSGIVNKGIIYGKNGTGKSNLGRALFDIEKNLMIHNNKNIFAFDTNPTYCCLDSNKDVFFSYSFRFGKDSLVYEYHKKDAFYVSSEKIFINEELMFDYTGDKGNVFCKFPGTENLSFASMNDGFSALSFLYRTFEFKDSPLSKLFDFVSSMLWFRCLTKGNEFEGIGLNEDIEQRIVTEDKLEDFQNFLKSFGLEYDLILKAQINIATGRSVKRIFAKFKHGEVPLAAIFSTGTQALELLYYWKMHFSKYKFIFIDEFDAFYHYELSAEVIKILNEGTTFQSFVTTHNTSLMNNDLMRPDCLFLISDNKIKNLADCTSKDLREGHNLEKIYRSNDFNV